MQCKQIFSEEQEQELPPISINDELTKIKGEEQCPQNEVDQGDEFVGCSNIRSTYYQTNHSTSIVIPTSDRPWISPPSKIVKKQSFMFRSSLHKKNDFKKYSPQSPLKSRKKITIKNSQFETSPQRTSFRLRLVKPNPSLFQLKPCVSASSFYAMWNDGGQPLMAGNQLQLRQIASLTKIMTAYTVINLCQEYHIRVREQWIPIHTQASYMQGTSANLRTNQQILLIDLLYGLLLPSGNDAGIALAQFFGKFLSFKLSKQQSNQKYTPNIQQFNQALAFYDNNYQKQSIKLFVFMMNRNAHKLGLQSTHFDNPTGLTNKNNYSCAKDMAILTSALMKSALLRQIVKRKVHKCEVKNQKLGYTREVVWQNTNHHLYKIRQCIGVKTGITPGAGPCLSSAYRVGTRELIVIVLGCVDRKIRFQDAEKIYRWCRQQQIYKSGISS